MFVGQKQVGRNVNGECYKCNVSRGGISITSISLTGVQYTVIPF